MRRTLKAFAAVRDYGLRLQISMNSIAHYVYVNCVVEILIIWSDPKIKFNVNELAHGK